MRDSIKQDLLEICKKFKYDTGILVSNTTIEIAAEIISAICDDPHPSWKYRDARLIDTTKTYMEYVPMMLKQIAASQRVEDEITTFDLLHWLSGDNISMLCIIPK